MQVYAIRCISVCSNLLKVYTFFWDRTVNLLHSSDWPWSHNSSASASWVLKIKGVYHHTWYAFYNLIQIKLEILEEINSLIYFCYPIILLWFLFSIKFLGLENIIASNKVLFNLHIGLNMFTHLYLSLPFKDKKLFSCQCLKESYFQKTPCWGLAIVGYYTFNYLCLKIIRNYTWCVGLFKI